MNEYKSEIYLEQKSDTSLATGQGVISMKASECKSPMKLFILKAYY